MFYRVLLILFISVTAYSQDIGLYPGTINLTPSHLVPNDQDIYYDCTEYQNTTDCWNDWYQFWSDTAFDLFNESPPKYIWVRSDAQTPPNVSASKCISEVGVSDCTVIEIYGMACPDNWGQWSLGNSSYCVPQHDFGSNNCPAGYTYTGLDDVNSPYEFLDQNRTCWPDIDATQCAAYAASVAAINYAWAMYPSGATFCNTFFDLDQDGFGETALQNPDTGIFEVEIDLSTLETALNRTGIASNDCSVAPTCDDGSAECALVQQTWFSMCTLDTALDNLTVNIGSGGSGPTPVEYGDPFFICEVSGPDEADCYITDPANYGLFGGPHDPFVNDPLCEIDDVAYYICESDITTYCNYSSSGSDYFCGSPNCEWSDAQDGSCEDIPGSGGGDPGTGEGGGPSGITAQASDLCDSTPTCSSADSFECASLIQQFYTMCAGQATDQELLDAVDGAFDPGTLDVDTMVADALANGYEFESTIDITADPDTSAFLNVTPSGAGSCPADLSADLGQFGVIEIDVTQICSVLQILAMFLRLTASMISFGMVFNAISAAGNPFQKSLL